MKKTMEKSRIEIWSTDYINNPFDEKIRNPEHIGMVVLQAENGDQYGNYIVEVISYYDYIQETNIGKDGSLYPYPLTLEQINKLDNTNVYVLENINYDDDKRFGGTGRVNVKAGKIEGIEQYKKYNWLLKDYGKKYVAYKYFESEKI